MTKRTTLPAIFLIAGLATAGCSSSGDQAADAKPSTSPSASASTTSAYTKDDCLLLAQRNFEARKIQDVSDSPECAHLTEDEYVEVVGSVLTDHKDELLEDAATETAWDSAWEDLTFGEQSNICEGLEEFGPGALAEEMRKDPTATGDELEMVTYFLEEKC